MIYLLFCRPSAGPGFPGHTHPPEVPPDTTPHPPPSPSQDPTVTTAQRSPPPPPPSSSVTTPPRQLVEGERQYSFTAGELDPVTTRVGEKETQNEEEEERSRGLFTVGESSASLPAAEGGTISADGHTEGSTEEGGSGGQESGVSPTHVDELRQRRLQRFHSMPVSPVREDSATLVEDKSEAVGAHSVPPSDKEQ